MCTIQEHYEHLRAHDPDRWNAMNGALAGKWLNKSDCLTYFRRSVLPKEGKPELHLDTSTLPAWIVKQLVDFLGFSWENIFSNTVPELPMVEPTMEKA